MKTYITLVVAFIIVSILFITVYNVRPSEKEDDIIKTGSMISNDPSTIQLWYYASKRNDVERKNEVINSGNIKKTKRPIKIKIITKNKNYASVREVNDDKILYIEITSLESYKEEEK